MEDELIFEMEQEIPENWESNRIIERDGRGRIIEVNIPDDKEE